MALLKSQAKYDDPILREAIKEFIIDGRTRNLSPETTAYYERRLGEFLKPWLEAPLAELSIHAVRERIAQYQGDGYSPATVNGYIRSVKALLNWALREDYDIMVNPRALAKVKEPKRVMPHLNTQEEIVALLSQPDQRGFVGFRDYMMILLMLDTGMRVSELVGLDVDDVSLPLLKVRGKGDKERVVALSDATQKALMKYMRAHKNYAKGVPFLFPSRHGGRVSKRTVAVRLKRYGEAAGITGISLSPHKMRYTFATHYLRNGGSIVSLQQTLGHTTLAMTRHYAQMVNADAFEDVRKFSPVSKLKL